MSFQFQLLTQLDSIHKNVKQEDIDREKIRKWVLQKLKDDPRENAEALRDIDALYQKLFHEVLEVINELKLMRPQKVVDQIEEAFGEDLSGKTVTREEAAQMAKVDKRTISRWAKEQKIERAPNKHIKLYSLLKHIGKRP